MSQQHPSVDGTVDLIPTKETLTSLKSDVTTVTAIQELIDNALDKARREHDLAEPLHIEVLAEHTDADRTELVVRDDAGGVRRDNAHVIFRLGESEDHTDYPLIGAYGLGAKKALMNLGLPFTIASRHEDEDIGWSYTIRPEWVTDDDEWEVEITPEEGLEPGQTEIRVQDLDHNWITPEDAEDGETPTAERLRDAFGHTYNLFLSDELSDEEYDVTIEVQGEAVTPLGSPDFAFTPIDEMYPRRFENITVDLDGWATTDVDITVGELREVDDGAGVDIYIQGRQVLYGARDERVGFGDELNSFDSGHDERLKVIVEMETTGDGRDLPWDTQKNNVDAYNPIMEEVQNWVKRTAKEYQFLDDTKVPAAFVGPYSPSISEAANGGEVVHHDFDGRTRVTSRYRPDTDQEDVTRITKIASAHAQMRFRCERAVDDDEVPAYREMVERQLNNRSYTDLEELDVDPVDFDEGDAGQIARDIEQLAERHVEEEIQYGEGLEIWQQPKYWASLTQYLEESALTADELETPETPPEDLPVTLDDLRDESEEGDETPLGRGGSGGTTPDPDPGEMVEVALRIIGGGGGREAILLEGPRDDLVEEVDLDADAGDDELAAELNRRLENALRF